MISTTKNPAQRASAGRARKTFSCLAAGNDPATALDDVALATITDANLPLRTLSIDLATTIALGAERAKGGAQ